MTFPSELDKNGYAPSILQDDLTRCYLCGRTDRKLDRHEVYGAANRQKSKSYGLWVMLCHEDCHQGPHGVHSDGAKATKLREESQAKAMSYYGWTTQDFRARFFKSYL